MASDGMQFLQIVLKIVLPQRIKIYYTKLYSMF